MTKTDHGAPSCASLLDASTADFDFPDPQNDIEAICFDRLSGTQHALEVASNELFSYLIKLKVPPKTESSCYLLKGDVRGFLSLISVAIDHALSSTNYALDAMRPSGRAALAVKRDLMAKGHADE